MRRRAAQKRCHTLMKKLRLVCFATMLRSPFGDMGDLRHKVQLSVVHPCFTQLCTQTATLQPESLSPLPGSVSYTTTMVAIMLALVGLLVSAHVDCAQASRSASNRGVAFHQQQHRHQHGELATAWVLPSLFGATQQSGTKATVAKQELLEAIAPLKRGLVASPEDIEVVEKLAQKLEKINPNPKSLSSPLINGRWELLYTTSESILGKNQPPFLRPSGPIYQDIDAPGLRAFNSQYVEPLPFLKLPNSVSAALTPTSASAVDVQFVEFRFGPLKFKAPESAKGALDTTYVDEEVRVSRGDKGNLFVLTRAVGMETGFA